MGSGNTRKLEILDAVVALSIETGRPVASSLVARYLSNAYSPATIRAVMKQLEEEGFLLQPHTSAGREPTDQGYRSFVDRLLAAGSLQPWQWPRQLQRAVHEDLYRSLGSGNLVKMLASLLSRLTTNISIILGPSWESVVAQRVEFYPKESQRILVVLVLENGMVRTGLFSLDRTYSRPVIELAARILSERISGRTVAEVRTDVLASLDESSLPANRCAVDVARRGRDLFADMTEGELELEGVSNVLDEPEFSQPGRLKSLIRFLESPRTLRDTLLRQRGEAGGRLGVWIGAENPVGELRSFSLLSSSFAWGGREGILAVLGPRRMPYHRAFSSFDMLRRTLQLLA